MRTAFLLAAMGAALALSGCGKGKDEVAAPTGEPVAAVAAPAGTSWSETIGQTPEGGFVMGNPQAKLTLVEYGSFTCPHCRDLAKEADEPLRKYVDTGKISYEFRSFARNPLDVPATMIARCGGKDPYYALISQIFATQDAIFQKAQAAGEKAPQDAMALPPQQRFVKLGEIMGLVEFAREHGVPEPQARACLADFKQAEKLAADTEGAVKKYNIEGTPTMILNGKTLENANTWATLEPQLKAAGL